MVTRLAMYVSVCRDTHRLFGECTRQSRLPRVQFVEEDGGAKTGPIDPGSSKNIGKSTAAYRK